MRIHAKKSADPPAPERDFPAGPILEAILDQSSDGIVVADLDGQIQLVGKGARHRLGYGDPAAFADLRLADLLPAGQAAELLAKLRGAAPGEPGRLVWQRCVARACDGEEVPISLSAARIETDAGTAVVLLFRDLRRLEQLERKLDEARRQLLNAEKLASVGKMAAAIAHEINNPLAGVVMYAALLLERMDPDDPRHEDLASVIHEATRCREIVRDLLEYAHPAPLQFGPLAVNPVVETALRLLVKKATFRNIRVTRDLAADLPPVLGDAGRLRQVVLNLLANAVEAMGDHGELVVRTARAESTGFVRIEVTDTGPGIPEGVLPRIFDPFFTTKEAGKGTGLGLAVSYAIVKEHHGFLRVESKPGRGTSFFVDLPVAEEGIE